MTLALLHGFSGSPESWDHVRAALPTPTIAVLLPGHKEEPAPQSFEDALDGLEAQLSKVSAAKSGLELVGYSLGARLALGLLLRGLVRRATLIGVNPGLEGDDARASRIAADDAWAERIQADFERFVDDWAEQALFSTQSADQKRAQRHVRLEHSPVGLAQAMRNMSLARMPNQWPQLGAITVPVQLLTGERDDKFTNIAQRMNERMTTAEHHVVSGAGHNLLAEAPDRLAEHIARFHGLTPA